MLPLSSPAALPSGSRRLTARRIRCRSVIFCEAVAIYGVIVSIILQTKMEKPDLTKQSTFIDAKNYNIASGYALFWAGICCGVGNLACGCVSLQRASTPVAPLSSAGLDRPPVPRTEPAPSRRTGCASVSAVAAVRWLTRRTALCL